MKDMTKGSEITFKVPINVFGNFATANRAFLINCRCLYFVLFAKHGDWLL